VCGVELRTSVKPVAFRNGVVEFEGGDSVRADFVFAQSELTGIRVDGLPQDRRGLLAIDQHCRVSGLSDVYAAGDVTAGFPKQGGLAARQADAAADMILAHAGWTVQPEPFEPVLEGVLLTPEQLAELRAGMPDGREITWHTPTKIVARHLTPYLGTREPESRDPHTWQGELRLPRQIELSQLLGR
jgi:NADH dehydrogenase FAD-containing subunit